MCTLTIFSYLDGHIVSMNRDEAISRHESGLHELCSTSSESSYWWPVDAVSTGTWFGVRGDGVVAAVLNRYQQQDSVPAHNRSGRKSRGRIIPDLLMGTASFSAGSLAGRSFQHYCATGRFAPFDLVVLYQGDIFQCSWDGHKVSVQCHSGRTHFFLTSSSVDYDACLSYRSQQLQQFIEQPAPITPPRVITELHRQPCVENPSLGICMSRPGRATLSISQAVVSCGRVVDCLHIPRRDFCTSDTLASV